ncbi:MAG: response regulator [Verrucomicrobiota bacterium]|jgi:CheY-like chemotaxis protein
MNRPSPIPLRLLIVEDEAIVAADIEDRVGRLGYGVAGIADGGEQAIAMAGQLKPDLVLMDIILKGAMRGTEAAARIAGELKIPIVYLTANADDQTFFAALDSAPFGYVLKPFEDRELQIAIEIALYKHRLEQERESLIAQLREALAEVRKLSTLLPICAWCKRVRDDQGYWMEVQAYLNEHSTHSACPECTAKLMQEADELFKTSGEGPPP